MIEIIALDFFFMQLLLKIELQKLKIFLTLLIACIFSGNKQSKKAEKPTFIF